MKAISQRLIEIIPFPPYLTGLLVSSTCFIAYFLLALNNGLVASTLSGEISSDGLRASLTLMVLVGYLPVAHWYLRKWTWEHIGELNARFQLADQRHMPGKARLISVGMFGSVAFVGLFLILPGPSYSLLQPWNWDLDFWVIFVAMLLVGWYTGRFSYELVWSALQLTKLANRLPKLDLLDTESYKPFTQHGVQSALLIVIMMSITAYITAQPGAGLVGAIINTLLMLTIAVIALVLPMRGVRRRIQAQKCEELATIRNHIRLESESVLAGTGETGDSLAALLAMELRIERVHEWPIDVGSLSRIALYLMLGLGSWIGAALVERMLESAL